MKIEFNCHACGETFEYNTKNYGGYSTDFNGNLCKQDWTELMEIKRRHNKELEDFKNSRKTS